MEPLRSMSTLSSDSPSEFCRDLENLLCFLDRAEKVATSACSPFVATKTDNNLLSSFLVEPTPIRPDLEMTVHERHLLMKNNHQHMLPPAPKENDPIYALAGSSISDIFSNADMDPPKLEERENCSSVSPDVSFSIGNNCSSQPTKHSSSTSIRFRKYQTSQWDDRFSELLRFQQEYGHLLVPHSYLPNPKLSQWVKRQRNQYKRKQMGLHSTLTNEREELLLGAGFIFDSHRAVWQMRFETLKAFYMANGNHGIPAKLEDGSLNVWIKHQRRQYLLSISGEESSMTEERIAALNSIGFDWNPRNLHRPRKS
ncbi:helicase domain protein [Nitzschia inconspicua]|uniref:Helicase domain protein n=1 Tax=Nitzschia inconspicua TaxID=303405 RepID=A0A9K3KAU2_9STRA|nr:helicase domain protein [Nitzschia inconspicua]